MPTPNVADMVILLDSFTPAGCPVVQPLRENSSITLAIVAITGDRVNYRRDWGLRRLGETRVCRPPKLRRIGTEGRRRSGGGDPTPALPGAEREEEDCAAQPRFRR